jgi:hypothetical protein
MEGLKSIGVAFKMYFLLYATFVSWPRRGSLLIVTSWVISIISPNSTNFQVAIQFDRNFLSVCDNELTLVAKFILYKVAIDYLANDFERCLNIRSTNLSYIALYYAKKVAGGSSGEVLEILMVSLGSWQRQAWVATLCAK